MPDSGQRLEFTLNSPDERLDKALAAARPDWSRTQWQQLIKEEQVTVDGVVEKPSFRLAGGELIVATIPPVQETDLEAEAIPLDIRYEDDDIIVVNKPAPMVVHPSAGHDSGTLVNAILGYCPDLEGVGGERRPGIVHRLDKETSGLIVVAKNDKALRYLQKQFKQRSVHKVYLALVEDRVQPNEALIDAPIGRDPDNRKRMAVIPPGSAANARSAQTYFKAEQFYPDQGGGFTLVRCEPRTGRTHQIRVHMAYIGHPLVGDKIYGRRRQRIPLARHFLHATELGIKRPSDHRPLTIQADLCPDLQTVIDRLAGKQ